MSTSNILPQKEFNSDDTPEKRKLLVHKGVLQRISQELRPPKEMRTITKKLIEQFIKELDTVIVEMKAIEDEITDKPYVSDYFRSKSLANVFGKVRDYAYVELLVSLDKLDEGDEHEHYRCLFRCSDYLEEALKEFKI